MIKTLSEIVQHLSADLGTVALDVLAPQRLLNLSIVDRSNVERRQPGFAAELLAGEDGREDGSTIGQTMLLTL